MGRTTCLSSRATCHPGRQRRYSRFPQMAGSDRCRSRAVASAGRPNPAPSGTFSPEASMLSTNDIPLSESALLVVDAQDSFKVDPKWERRNNRDFERNVGALIDAYRAAGRPVIFFLHTDSDPGFERASIHVKLMDFITVHD